VHSASEGRPQEDGNVWRCNLQHSRTEPLEVSNSLFRMMEVSRLFRLQVCAGCGLCFLAFWLLSPSF